MPEAKTTRRLKSKTIRLLEVLMQKNREDSICWVCARACDGSCSWSDSFTPVEGWTAEYCEKYGSYSVSECPLFTQEVEKHKCSKLNEKGALELMQRVLEVARDDYIKSPRQRQDIEKWIRKKGAVLCMFDDPDGVIKRLRREAGEYDRRCANRLMR